MRLAFVGSVQIWSIIYILFFILLSLLLSCLFLCGRLFFVLGLINQQVARVYFRLESFGKIQSIFSCL